MATWQFDVHLLPVQEVLRRYQAIPVVISRQDFDLGDWWTRSPVPSEFEAEISKLLPHLRSWTEKLRQWGFDDGDRIGTWWDSGSISDVHLRFDVRNLSLLFITNVMGIARRYDCLVRTQEGHVFQPSTRRLLSAIRASDAFNFVQDPHAFLDDLATALKREDDGES